MIAIIATALVFDYTNGFHDAANAIATSVSTRAFTPRVALGLAAVANLVGALLGEGVAKTVGSGIIDPPKGSQGLLIVFCGVVGGIVWNLLTWYFGLPSSSSHALIGGLVGSALAASAGIHWASITDKVIIPMIASPLIGLVLAYLFMLAILWIFRHGTPGRLSRGFRWAQRGSATAMAVGHGLQDGQKTAGVIVLALAVGGYEHGSGIPLWVKFAVAVALGAGTYAGGWRIMRTLGRRIIHLDPARGFAAETVAAGVLYTTAFVFKAPISTTHTITSAVMGVGATKRLSAVRWGVAGNIATAWVLTIPAAAAVAAAAYLVLRPIVL
ncbi:MAG TPA: inorganic phosphate transporter [Mycobacteriales bacterium]|jgi:PiT family inorganic phosphate transporter|nr:inorganic phosphate transporter [Mycobacteriales bacterium]